MQGMGDKRFSGAGFAFDQHMAVGLPQIEDILAQAIHHGAGPDQFFHNRAAIRQFAAQCASIEHQAAGVRGLFGQLGHPVGVERFFQKIIGPEAHRLDRHGHIAMPGDHDYRQGTVHAFDLFQELHPVHARHLDVADHNARIIGAKPL